MALSSVDDIPRHPLTYCKWQTSWQPWKLWFFVFCSVHFHWGSAKNKVFSYHTKSRDEPVGNIGNSTVCCGGCPLHCKYLGNNLDRQLRSFLFATDGCKSSEAMHTTRLRSPLPPKQLLRRRFPSRKNRNLFLDSQVAVFFQSLFLVLG